MQGRELVPSAESVVAALADFTAASNVEEASYLVPDVPGLYSIHVRDAAALPEPWRSKLTAKRTRLLYIGQASESLRTRLVEEELQHRRAATFFRGLGAALGYRPARGSLVGKKNQKNYRFSTADTDKIVRWMAANLKVCWVPVPSVCLDAIEVAAIQQLRPLFNTTDNPERCADLRRVRKECRDIARASCTE